jgi:hypothetical protein
MRVLNSSVIAENLPLRLSLEQMADPGETLRSLFTNWTLDEMREALWDIFSRSLAAKDEDLGPFSASEILFYYEEIIQVLEAACLIYRVPGRVA